MKQIFEFIILEGPSLKILRFVSPYQEFAKENLKRRHCVFLVLEGFNRSKMKLKSTNLNGEIVLESDSNLVKSFF